MLDELGCESWTGEALVFVASLGLSALMTPRPWAASILLSALLLLLLLRHRDSGRARPLCLVPALFAVWANLHIQFVLGLAWIGLACAGTAIEARRARRPLWPAARPLLLCLAASAAATLLNPYGPRLYSAAWDLAVIMGDFGGLQDTTPTWRMTQRFVWAVPVFLALIAVDFARGRRARRLRAFSSLLFLAGTVLGLRMIRDYWALFLGGIVFAADGRAAPADQRRADSASDSHRLPSRHARAVAAPSSLRVRCAVMAGGLVFNLVFGFTFYGRPLEQALEMRFPAGAARFVAARVPPGAIFNDYNWGGYLIWALPKHRVTLDGRSPVCGPALYNSTLAAWLGQPGWRDNADLLGARAVIANRAAPLTELLASDARFQATYADSLAVVFERR